MINAFLSSTKDTNAFSAKIFAIKKKHKIFRTSNRFDFDQINEEDNMVEQTSMHMAPHGYDYA